jgi:hypothetical protein
VFWAFSEVDPFAESCFALFAEGVLRPVAGARRDQSPRLSRSTRRSRAPSPVFTKVWTRDNNQPQRGRSQIFGVLLRPRSEGAFADPAGLIRVFTDTLYACSSLSTHLPKLIGSPLADDLIVRSVQYETFGVLAVYTLYEDECEEHLPNRPYTFVGPRPSRVGKPFMVT